MTTQQVPLIVFLTDFGSDPYSGIMKGRILQINPQVRIISLSNNVQNHNIRQGAFILLKSYQYFPPKTIFLVVVDPGVGGPRKAIAAKSGDYYFVAPDNGILAPILSKDEKTSIVILPSPNKVSSTFHGRDVFAPAAAKLSLNYSSFKSLGIFGQLEHTLKFNWDPVRLLGEVIFIDHFGNIITNIPDSLNLSYEQSYIISTKNFNQKLFLKRSYYEGEDNDPFLVLSSFGTLEIALRNKNAANTLSIKPGEKIQIYLE